MITSLRIRLLGGFLLVALVAVGVVAALASQVTSGQFRGYVEQRVELGRSRYELLLGRYFLDQGSWEGVQSAVERMGEISGDQIVLLDASGRVIADSGGKLVGRQPEQSWTGGPIPIMRPGPGPAPGPGRGQASPKRPAELLGAIFVNPLAAADAENSFLNAVNSWLLIAAGAAGVLALLLTLAVSRRILGPIESLTAAVKRMEGGDLSSRVAVQGRDEIGTLGNAFNAMAESLAKDEDLRRHMVSDVAHELRTPLTNIRGYLEGMRDGVFAADRQTIDTIHQEAELLSRIVDDLQELALAEAGQLRLVRQPAAVTDLVERTVGVVRAQFEARRVGLRADVADGLPLIDADAKRICQVLRILLNNSLAHTPSEGEVIVTVGMVDTSVAVCVGDTGSGIPLDHLPYVFERFYRVDQSRARKSGGAGLGLAIARQLIEAHGGQIKAESEPGHGAKFTFTIPSARPEFPIG